MINDFDLNCYSEELFTVTEQEHDQVMEMVNDEAECLSLYASRFYVGADGQVHEAPEPPSIGRIGGFEL